MGCGMGTIGCVLVLAALLQGATAATYTVLDTQGWIIPSSNDVYDTWTTGKTFYVGDILTFAFSTGAHDVATVNETAYDDCIKTNPISHVTNGPANITLDTVGKHYYICTVGQHCASGQKLEITVSESNGTRTPAPTTPPTPTTPAPTTPPTPTTPTTPTTPPTTTSPAPTGTTPPSPTTPSPSSPPSTASSIAVGGFSVALLSIAIAFLH